MKISNVTHSGNYTIHVEFDDGTSGSVDLTDLVDSGVFTILKDVNRFSKVYTTGYSIAWSDELEIDAARIYAELTGKDPSSCFPPISYASN